MIVLPLMAGYSTNLDRWELCFRIVDGILGIVGLFYIIALRASYEAVNFSCARLDVLHNAWKLSLASTCGRTVTTFLLLAGCCLKRRLSKLQDVFEGLSYLAAMRNSKLGHNRTPVEGQQGPPWPEKIFHPRFGSSRNENDEDKVIKKGTRSSSARPSLWRWTIVITLSFLFNLTSYHFLRFFNQVQTSKEVWCHFQEVWRLDVHNFHQNF